MYAKTRVQKRWLKRIQPCPRQECQAPPCAPVLAATTAYSNIIGYDPESDTTNFRSTIQCDGYSAYQAAEHPPPTAGVEIQTHKLSLRGGSTMK